jgi:hypothetical protein
MSVKVVVSAVKRVSKAQERALQLRQDFWSEISEDKLWHRKKHAGYTSIPRTMPVLMNIIDALSKNQPAGRTYFVLWSRTYDESLLIIDNPMTLAWEAGFTGERALSTWKQRMRTLQDLGFILAKGGAAGAFHYVLLLNPHQVVWGLRAKIQEQMFRQLIDRANDIGAKDMRAPILVISGRSRAKKEGKKA